jgi:hypothetical protein
MSTQITYERIFTNSEIQLLESHIKYLLTRQKDIKAYVREEFKKIQLRLEKEVMDAQQEGKSDVAKTYIINFFSFYRIEETADLCVSLTKITDDDIDRDSIYLEEQLKLLKNICYEKDYWKELELKGIIGDEIIKMDTFQKDCDEHFRVTKERFEVLMRDIRRLIDKLNFPKIIEIFSDLGSPSEPNTLPVLNYTIVE